MLFRVVGAAPRYVAVVCVLAILRAVLARGTLACYGTCGSACGAVVGTLRWGLVWFRFQLASCCSPPYYLPPQWPGCAGSAGVIVRVVMGRWLLVFAVYRVGGTWGWCAWCVLPASGAAETVGAGRALCPPLGCCRWRAWRCGFPPGVVVPVLLLHRVLCLYCVCGLSCAPRMWSWRHRLYVHLILYRCVLSHACVHLTGLVGGIPLALGVGVSWILFARCSARHKWSSLSSVSSSHVEELRHIGGRVRSCWVAALCLWFVAWRPVVVLSCCATLDGVRLCGVAWLWRCVVSQRVLSCVVVWR